MVPTFMPRQSPMKKTRDSERTRKAILDNAAKLFAARGFAGTSVAQIAKAAKVHKRMLHYCYGSKSGLYKEVVEHTAAHYSVDQRHARGLFFVVDLFRRNVPRSPDDNEIFGLGRT